MSKNHLIEFLTISDRYHNFYFCEFFHKMATLDVRKSLSIAFLAISDRYGTFFFNFDKMAAGSHFWMSKNHFRSHFWPFQIDPELVVEFF